eukprot:TRINITY_DN25907_c0_g1_i1.p2 TRINITY_DN25907_c0_g1~~TRINITY_DN25907_c0_g1_i1.p2  ORF type:complete len:120 (+),score=25.84 TRINITY_DN25907_c0_g1_i1:104-463(+)
MNPEDSNDIEELEESQRSLTPLQLLEQELRSEFEQKQREMEERVNKLEIAMNKNNEKNSEAILRSENTRINHEKWLNKIDKQFENTFTTNEFEEYKLLLSLIHICRCRRYAVCRSRWSP